MSYRVPYGYRNQLDLLGCMCGIDAGDVEAGMSSIDGRGGVSRWIAELNVIRTSIQQR